MGKTGQVSSQPRVGRFRRSIAPDDTVASVKAILGPLDSARDALLRGDAHVVRSMKAIKMEARGQEEWSWWQPDQGRV